MKMNAYQIVVGAWVVMCGFGALVGWVLYAGSKHFHDQDAVQLRRRELAQ